MFLVPTRVGMILLFVLVLESTVTCPHTRGDDPRIQAFITG